MRAHLLAATAALALSGVALAQDRQEVIPPRTVYWMDAITVSGMARMAGGFNPLQALSNGGGGGSTRLELEIASQDRPARGPVEANHSVPRGARVGPDLRLEANAPSQPVQDGPIADYERPRGRIFLFYGCGERAARGQPIVIDFARVAEGEMPAGLQSRVRGARSPNRPGERGWPSVAYGPRQRGIGDVALIPSGGSLVGDHRIRATMGPDIRFSLTADYDVLAPISLTTNAPNPSGSVALAWSPVPRATAYGLAAMGRGEREGDIVYWTSSAVQTWDAGFSEPIAPSEAARLVRERVLLGSEVTNCTVPQEAARLLGVGSGDAERAAMVFMTAHGPEANFVDPPRPADMATPWRQNWAVKVRLSSTTMDMLGQSMASMIRQADAGAPTRDPLSETAPPAGMSQETWCRERTEARRNQADQSVGANVGEAIGSATGIPGAGMLGRALGRSRSQPPEDPYCPGRR